MYIFKADESVNDELEAARMIKRRVEHLKEAEYLHDHTRPLWQKKRLDRMLVRVTFFFFFFLSCPLD